ncbi:MAG TPA: hypothetical protein VMR52_12885 [Dehalococcoidia bacterium]|nr:hypothetical protein [Dehalococcoidia bacterium]
MSDLSFKQTQAMIGLLARSTIGLATIFDTVTNNKKDPKAYVRVYNSLSGDLGVTGAANMAKVSKGTMSTTLSSWEAQGIVYDIGESGKPQYVRLLKLPDKLLTK